MRQIKFRGKRIDTGEWVYGYYVVDPSGKSRIYWKPFPKASSNTYHFVDPETVGQFTGLHDESGTEIYEGDIINTYSTDFPVVVDDYHGFMFMVGLDQMNRAVGLYGNVTGNIHDNK